MLEVLQRRSQRGQHLAVRAQAKAASIGLFFDSRLSGGSEGVPRRRNNYFLFKGEIRVRRWSARYTFEPASLTDSPRGQGRSCSTPKGGTELLEHEVRPLPL